MNLPSALLLAFLVTGAAHAETFSITYENGRMVERFPEKTRPVIGLALSGGGARGIAHLGVIEVLNNMGIRVERIAGTSMGSLVGGLYAAGYSTEYLINRFENTDWSTAMSSSPRRRSAYISSKEMYDWPLFELRFEGLNAKIPSSLSSGQHYATTLAWFCLGPTYECRKNFDQLPIPFRSVATNLNTGTKEVLAEGNLARAIQASSTVPLLFTPVEWGNKLLVDGGLVDNLPVQVVRDMGSDFIIASVVEESMHAIGELDNAFNVADQVTSIPMRNMTRYSKNFADFVISPDVDEFSSTDFGSIHEMVEKGRQAALQAVPALMDSLELKSSACRKTVVDSITVAPGEDESFVRTTLSSFVTAGETTFFWQIAAGLESLWQSGRYCSVSADLDTAEGTLALTLIPVPATVVLVIQGRNQDEIINKSVTLPTETDRPLLMQEVIEKVDSEIRLIRSEGLSFTHVTGTEINQPPGTLTVTAAVPQLTDIVLDSNIKTRNTTILRELELKPGDPFNLSMVMSSLENLYGTNFFEWIYPDVEYYEDGVRLYIHMKEKNWTVTRLGLNYDEMYHTEGKITFSRENILGFGNQLAGTFQIGGRKRLLMLESRNDRIYSTLLTYEIKFYKNFRLRPLYADHSFKSDYKDDRYGAIFSIGQQMDKLGNAVIQLKTETLWLKTDPSSSLKGEKKELRSFVLRSLIDSYDQYPFPRRGKLNLIYIETTEEIIGGTEQFVKLYWGGSMVQTYNRRHTFSGSFFLGSADPSLPEIESFTLGGHPSRLNCYDHESTGSHFYADFPGLADEEKYGNRLAVAKAAYRLFVPKYFYLDLSYSFGNVWQKGEHITKETFLQAYGIMGSFATPGGPISLGWGITSEGDDRLYMSAGWEF
ncbi:patatin-like phospholipase family protein [bacterium]|nr:patatin-like phospholipase family protein [bacterium]